MLTLMRLLIAGVALASGSFAAHAQKSKDTLRIAVYEPIATTDNTYEPQPQTSLFSQMVYDNLVGFDAEKRETTPLIAESWKRIDDLSIEFKLRRDIRFHDGQPLDADDVVYSFNFLTDPKVIFRTKESRYGIFESIEKVDQYTVRIKTKSPFAPLLLRLASTLPIYPRIAHGKSPDRSQYGRLTPIGSGPYRAAVVDSEKGVVLLRNEHYKHGNAGKPVAKIARVEIVTVPDVQTQTARLLTGQQDLMYNLQTDTADFLVSNPALEIAMQDSIQIAALIFDMSGRSGADLFKDIRVRQALLHAIDRRAIARAMLPKKLAENPMQDALCHDWFVGCAHSLKAPAYDPAAAKKLLAEAGYPDGFSLTVTTWGPARPVTEAMEAQWRRIGVKAQIESLAFPAFVKKRSAGQLQAFVALWDNGGGQPDVDQTAAYFFEPDGRNYIKDPKLVQLYHTARSELNPDKRNGLYREMFDHSIRQHYAIPVFRTPVIVAHSKELRMPLERSRRPEGFEFNLLEWK
jgi:peptide/nickel transport system substrate-binding protein